MNIDDISTQLLFSTAPILCKTERESKTGTGFFYSYEFKDGRQIPFLITNYHVVEGLTQGHFEVHLEDKSLPSPKTVRINFDRDFIDGKKLGALDLAALPIAPALNELSNGGVPVFYRSISNKMTPSPSICDNLMALEEITFIGYPSGIYDSKNKFPLIRKGITASPIWADYEGESEFLIDASVFPGSSGSPAFIFNQGSFPTIKGISVGSRLLFVGVVTQTIVQNEKEYLDLGKVIKSSALDREMESLIAKMLSSGEMPDKG